MKIPGYRRAKNTARWLRSRFTDRAVILGYHRIADTTWDPFDLSVTPQHLAAQFDFLHKHTIPISLQELLQYIRQRKIPKRAVVVTFDDGYLDTLTCAKPLLEYYQIPATIFITTGNLGREYWWDELARLVGPPAELPSLLRNLGGLQAFRPHDSSQMSIDGGESKRRAQLAISLFQRMLSLDYAGRELIFSQLRAGPQAPSEVARARGMTPAELAQLAASDLIDIGAHSVTHPLLAHMPVAAQQAEMQQSKDTLRKLLDRPIEFFSYPNGSTNQEVIASVRAVGFACACASHPDTAWNGSNLLCLPRIWVPNRSGPAFSSWMRWWL